MARGRKKALAPADTAPENGAAVGAGEVFEPVEKEETIVPEVDSVQIVGQTVPADAFFVTPVDRIVELTLNDVPTPFIFKAGEPRQLPPGVICEAIGLGVQVAT